MQNHGFIKDEIVPEDFQFGGERSIENKFGALPLQLNGDWREFIFDGIISHQAPGYETNSCVSHGTANALELLRRKLYQYDNDLSDRYIAKASGTDPLRGNTPKTVAETVRKNFTVWENEWATKDAKTVDEFYAEIPQNLKTLAIARGAEWDFGYEYVPLNLTALREALKYSPLGISVPAWFEKGGRYYRPDGVNDSHWVCLMYIDEHGKMYILDSYDPTVKVMEAGFMPQVAMKYHLNRQVVNKSAFTKFLEAILAILFPKPEPVPVPVEPKKPDTVPVKEDTTEPYQWSTPDEVRMSIRILGDEYGMTPLQKDLACDIVRCESSFKPTATLKNSEKSIDRGLFQWNSYWHPQITDEIAYDPEKNARLGIQAIKLGKAKIYWSASMKCWNKNGKYDSII